MENSTLIIALALATLALGLAYGLWQRARVARSKAQNTHSAMTTPEPGVDKAARARAGREPTST